MSKWVQIYVQQISLCVSQVPREAWSFWCSLRWHSVKPRQTPGCLHCLFMALAQFHIPVCRCSVSWWPQDFLISWLAEWAWVEKKPVKHLPLLGQWVRVRVVSCNYLPHSWWQWRWSNCGSLRVHVCVDKRVLMQKSPDQSAIPSRKKTVRVHL